MIVNEKDKCRGDYFVSNAHQADWNNQHQHEGGRNIDLLIDIDAVLSQQDDDPISDSPSNCNLGSVGMLCFSLDSEQQIVKDEQPIKDYFSMSGLNDSLRQIFFQGEERKRSLELTAMQTGTEHDNLLLSDSCDDPVSVTRTAVHAPTESEMVNGSVCSAASSITDAYPPSAQRVINLCTSQETSGDSGVAELSTLPKDFEDFAVVAKRATGRYKEGLGGWVGGGKDLKTDMVAKRTAERCKEGLGGGGGKKVKTGRKRPWGHPLWLLRRFFNRRKRICNGHTNAQLKRPTRYTMTVPSSTIEERSIENIDIYTSSSANDIPAQFSMPSKRDDSTGRQEMGLSLSSTFPPEENSVLQKGSVSTQNLKNIVNATQRRKQYVESAINSMTYRDGRDDIEQSAVGFMLDFRVIDTVYDNDPIQS